MALKSAGTTDAFLSAVPRGGSIFVDTEHWSYLVSQEASEVAAAVCNNNTGSHRIVDQPAQVAECFIYMLELCCRGSHSIDFDLATHGTNYWVCDGIIQQLKQEGRDLSANDDSDWLWRAADALQREIALDIDYHKHLPSSHLSICVERKPYWISPNYGFNRVPGRAILNGGIFQHYLDKIRVLKLSRCTFNFQSPPFLYCHGLRFLWLDHCQDTGINTDGEGKEDVRRCFQRLWVLDVRYTHCDQILSGQMMNYMTQLRELNVMGAWEWDMGQLQGRLPNIRKLRVKYSIVTCSCPEEDLLSKMNNLELLDFSGNEIYIFGMTWIPEAITINNSSSCLETVNIGKCERLDRISFKGCTKLKNLLLEGSMSVYILDISGTAVKTLDLTATTNLGLLELYLLDCKKLCAILWPDNMKQDLDKLCIGTTQSAPTAQSREEIAKRGTTTAATIGTSAATTVLHRSRPTNEFPWYISVRDARLLMSLEAVYSGSRELYLEVSSTPSPTVFAAGCRDEGIKSGSSSEPAPAIYAAAGTTAKCDGDAPGIMWMWSCPDVPHLDHKKSCYMHIQETNTFTVPRFVINCAKILHVRDSMSITLFPSGTTEWYQLEWCRIERCPILEDVFTPGINNRGGMMDMSNSMKTFWASQLRKASCIWQWSEPWGFFRTFQYLVFLHLDCCPRLVHVLPSSTYTIDTDSTPLPLPGSLSQLETLEITWCGDLREVFPVDPDTEYYVKEQPQPVTYNFPGLKRIHLHELPRLHSICGFTRMSAPNLESVKIRGCWSLKRLPDVGGGDKAVECDCEKEWWDRLEWDDGSQVTRYKPIHSRYYKKTLLRSSVLR